MSRAQDCCPTWTWLGKRAPGLPQSSSCEAPMEQTDEGSLPSTRFWSGPCLLPPPAPAGQGVLVLHLTFLVSRLSHI